MIAVVGSPSGKLHYLHEFILTNKTAHQHTNLLTT